MQKNRLNLYTLDMKYIRELSKVDDRVMSVSPQEHKENRPFVGIIVILEKKQYCIPLTYPKSKHEKMKNDLDFSKIFDKTGKLIGALNFNNMIPVSNDVITPLNIKPQKSDSSRDKVYKELLNNQLDWCNDNMDNITKKANKLYDFVTITPEKSYTLTRRCCDFKKLEQVLDKWLGKDKAIDTPEHSARMEDLLKESNKILNANPQLKKKFEQLFDEYFKRCGIPPIGSRAPLPERFRVLNAIIASDPAFKAEYINARDNFRNSAPSANRKPKPPKH